MTRRPSRSAERATDREVGVVAAVLVAGSEKAAAHRLGLSHSTVKHHLANARSRVGAGRRRSSRGYWPHFRPVVRDDRASRCPMRAGLVWRPAAKGPPRSVRSPACGSRATRRGYCTFCVDTSVAYSLTCSAVTSSMSCHPKLPVAVKLLGHLGAGFARTFFCRVLPVSAHHHPDGHSVLVSENLADLPGLVLVLATGAHFLLVVGGNADDQLDRARPRPRGPREPLVDVEAGPVPLLVDDDQGVDLPAVRRSSRHRRSLATGRPQRGLGVNRGRATTTRWPAARPWARPGRRRRSRC